ncbi:MAG: 6-carboxytetrahydropterin synthase [Elusimicrobia bacterium]|nr:6-carboxytetrahydropterin synthase [Elusimicrobiota bacterium]
MEGDPLSSTLRSARHAPLGLPTPLASGRGSGTSRTRRARQRASFQVTRVLRFCYGHRLLHYPGKCRHLHGHNARVEIELSSKKLNRLGMAVDFEKIKQKIQAWLDAELDHTMILHEKDPWVKILRAQNEPCLALKTNPTAENLAKLIYDYARGRGLPVTEVRLWETPHSRASYRRNE